MSRLGSNHPLMRWNRATEVYKEFHIYLYSCSEVSRTLYSRRSNKMDLIRENSNSYNHFTYFCSPKMSSFWFRYPLFFSITSAQSKIIQPFIWFYIKENQTKPKNYHQTQKRFLFYTVSSPSIFDADPPWNSDQQWAHGLLQLAL